MWSFKIIEIIVCFFFFLLISLQFILWTSLLKKVVGFDRLLFDCSSEFRFKMFDTQTTRGLGPPQEFSPCGRFAPLPPWFRAHPARVAESGGRKLDTSGCDFKSFSSAIGCPKRGQTCRVKKHFFLFYAICAINEHGRGIICLIIICVYYFYKYSIHSIRSYGTVRFFFLSQKIKIIIIIISRKRNNEFC